MEETTKCPFCSEEILKDAKKCKHCGEFLEKGVRPQPQYIPKKSSGLAAILSLCCVGLGQIYNGQFIKGFLYFFVFVILLIWAGFMGIGSIFMGSLTAVLLIPFIFGVLPIISFWIFGMVDAYKTSERINKGEV